MVSWPRVHRAVQLFACALLIAGTGACAGSGDERPVLTADMLLHLEDHLDAATIEGSELPATIPEVVEWRFDEPQPDWKVARPPAGGYSEADLTRTSNALRVSLPEGRRNPNGLIAGGMYIDLPDWRREEWGEVLVRARTEDPVVNMSLLLNPQEAAIRETMGPLQQVFQIYGGVTPIVSDGSVQTYRIALNWGDDGPGAWRRVGLGFGAREPASIDILSVSVVPTAALYAQEKSALRSIAVAGTYRRSLFTHAPGRIAYRVRVPDGGRLQAGLGVPGARVPVEFRISARTASGEATTLFSETHADPESWAEHSVDLSGFAGQTVTLALETDADAPGTVAFWGAPTLSGVRRTDKPNVILYVIDGGGADYMSVYGYNRRTTPNLERLAAEGALFERAYSNSSWTKPSTASFMTSLHNSVLGNTRRNPVEPLSADAVTMAERFHRAGYQTAVFTSNANAGTVSGLQRGADLLREFESIDDARSSTELHAAFWRWRGEAPGQPYWVHFQTTDVHAVGSNQLELSDSVPVYPFAGLFVSPQDVVTLRAWSARVQAGGGRITSRAFDRGGLSRASFLTLYQGMYDQQMAHNDFQLGRLVDRLKASGEWQNTILIVAADHSIESALTATEIGMLDPLPAGFTPGGYAWNRPIFRPSISRVPLIVVWPGHIAGDQRFEQAASMIDVLPTLLDLTGLPMPDVTQGQSLAPLLRGTPDWTPRPVIFDEFEVDRATGDLGGLIEVVDGRWGASLEIGGGRISGARVGPPPSGPDTQRPVPLLLYDLWNDPLCVAPVNEQYPDLVQKYTTFLEDQWKAHQALATQFTPGAKVALTPEQLERLRALGYIR